MWELSFPIDKKLLLSLLLLLFVSNNEARELNLSLSSLSVAANELEGQILTIEKALDRVQIENPGLAEMQARAQAMEAIPSQVGSLPDPVVSINTLNLPTNTFDLDQERMTQFQFEISQKIPYPGKLALKHSIAEYMANAADSSVDNMRLQLNRDVKTLWWRLFFLDRSLEIIEINKTLLRQFIEIAQTKYKVGEGLQQDVLLAQLELSKLLDSSIQLVAMRKQESARLNALLNQATEIAVLLPSLTDINTDLAPLKALTDIFEISKRSQPSLIEQEILINAAYAKKELAERELLPDFNVGVSYGLRQNSDNGDKRSDLLSFKLAVTVPFYAETKQKMAISQRQIEVKQQQYSLQDKWITIQADITSTIADYERTREQVSLFKTGVIPQARQTVASMLVGYQVNKVDFLNLIRAQITLYNYETRLWQTISEGQSAVAKLIATVGEENIYE